MLDQKNKIAAKNKLEKYIKDKLDKWLIIYTKENSLQYSKKEIIELVDDIINTIDGD